MSGNTGYQTFLKDLSSVTNHSSEISRTNLDQLLDEIPTLESALSSKPKSAVIRLDLDVSTSNGEIVDPIRVDSTIPTIERCLKNNMEITILGHIGRSGHDTLRPVRDYLSAKLGCDIDFVSEWLDEESWTLTPEAASNGQKAKSRVRVFENTRKYDVETAIWRLNSSYGPEKLYSLATQFRKISDFVVNDAIAASNLDFSSTVLPLVTSMSCLGSFSENEFRNHVTKAMRSQVIVFSGAKLDKLDSLEAIVKTSRITTIIVAGAISMALLGSQSKDRGRTLNVGQVAHDPTVKGYISEERFSQANRILKVCENRGINVVLPVDFILANGKVAELIPDDTVQLDIGPKTSALFHETVTRHAQTHSREDNSLYFNGVFGVFERSEFAQGTRNFVNTIQEATKTGMQTYIGGGEGRLAVERFGSVQSVTHAFTCGGTILKCIAYGNVGFLRAMAIGNRV